MNGEAKYRPQNEVICPHCLTGVALSPTIKGADSVTEETDIELFDLTFSKCPICKRLIISLQEFVKYRQFRQMKSDILLWPFTMNRNPTPTQVPKHIANDYFEATMTLPFSPKASAALSRRCLQIVLTETGISTKKDLIKQIEEAITKLPSYIAENLDAVRNIGNFAAHQQKSINTGEILDVEPGEAEWNLDVLDALFDHCYVRPDIESKKREALNAKLTDAGKGVLKTPSLVNPKTEGNE